MRKETAETIMCRKKKAKWNGRNAPWNVKFLMVATPADLEELFEEVFYPAGDLRWGRPVSRPV